MQPNPLEIPNKKPRQIHLSFQHPKENWNAFLGVKLDETSYDLLVEEDADVWTPEGEILFRFRKRCLPRGMAEVAFAELMKIRHRTNNRGIAAGRIYADRKRTVTKEGMPTNTPRMEKGGDVMSSIIGYFDRYPRIPYCRETAYNADHPEAFARILPFLAQVDAQYQAMDQERYRRQRLVVDRTSPDFVIAGTSYTTITVNQNFQTAVHTDQGDLKDGLSNILVLRQGSFSGGNLVFPHYRAAVRLDSLDLMCFNSHHMHGNTPIVGSPGKFKRVSCVLYYRERMVDCGTAAEELERAKRRQKGERLHGKLTDQESDG